MWRDDALLLDMLVWVGKRPLARVTAFPAQHVETFDPSGALGRKPVAAEQWKDWPAAYPKGKSATDG